jgi:hypothetical protein
MNNEREKNTFPEMTDEKQIIKYHWPYSTFISATSWSKTGIAFWNQTLQMLTRDPTPRNESLCAFEKKGKVKKKIFIFF